MHAKRKFDLFQCCNYLFFIVIAFISIFPIYLIAANAFSTEYDIVNEGFAVYPLHFTLDAFRYLLKTPAQLLYSLFASVVYAVAGSLLSVCVQAMLGYSLTRKEFAFKKLCNVLLIITMFFNAGLIPSYIVNTQVFFLDNSWLVYLLPGSVSAFSVFVYRTFFQQIPHSLLESAELDGASHMQSLFRIIIPLSMPILAAQFFMTMTGRWKDYTISLYYVSDPNMYTLEYYIQTLLKDSETLKNNLMLIGIPATDIPLETMRFAVVFFTLIPMLVIFPIFQKRFSKGAMVGAVKG